MKKSRLNTSEMITVLSVFTAVFMAGVLVGYLFFQIATFAA